ncbi:MAG: aspartate aminotransferase family protein [Chloroflexi bacterium]|nr:aspartate aminotransferase family protein [Chloroflexota bacterium]
MATLRDREAQLYMQASRRMPVTVVRGAGTRVWDDEGREYLDFVAGIATNTLGHADPDLAEVIARQAKTLVHASNLVYTLPQIELAELLVAHSCADRVYFVNSGAEANETAVKLARKWGKIHRGGAHAIICAENAFHGRTLATIAATGNPRYSDPFTPLPEGFLHVPYDDLDALRAATGDETVAVMLEPLQGEGGINVPSPGYLRGVREWCDEQGLLLIFDEVQSGMGRTGTLWAYEQEGAEPDIFTSAKALGGGVPVGAALAREHAAVFEPGDHGNTFGGSVLATAAAAHVVRRLVEGGVLAESRARGEQLGRALEGLADRAPGVSGVRGRGLLRGLVLERDAAPDAVAAALGAGLILNAVRPNVLRFMPPLTVTEEEIAHAVSLTESALATVL